MTKIFIHGSGHKASSWNEVVKNMHYNKDILCPDLSSILNGKEASYSNLYSSFADYCNGIEGQIDLCGLSLGGILALNYVIEYPNKVKSLVVIGTPHKVPKLMFSIQNVIFRLLPKSIFKGMAFNKKDTFILGNTMKKLDFSNKVQAINCPTLIICGEKDKANMKSAYYLSQNIKRSDLVIIKQTGHIINEENPRELARILDNYYNNEN